MPSPSEAEPSASSDQPPESSEIPQPTDLAVDSTGSNSTPPTTLENGPLSTTETSQPIEEPPSDPAQSESSSQVVEESVPAATESAPSPANESPITTVEDVSNESQQGESVVESKSHPAQGDPLPAANEEQQEETSGASTESTPDQGALSGQPGEDSLPPAVESTEIQPSDSTTDVMVKDETIAGEPIPISANGELDSQPSEPVQKGLEVSEPLVATESSPRIPEPSQGEEPKTNPGPELAPTDAAEDTSQKEVRSEEAVS